MSQSERTYTESQVKDILHSITYSDVLTEEDLLSIVRLVIEIYSKCKNERTPDCLIQGALHNAVEISIQKYFEINGI